MTLLLIDEQDVAIQRFERHGLTAGFDEKWLRHRLFQHPDLLPPEFGHDSLVAPVPVCRELALPKSGGMVFLDLLYVTRTGGLILVECKLWRNPQARREVVAQILEYAALLRRWTYADLTAHLKARLGWSGETPLFDLVVTAAGDMAESAGPETVSRDLGTGDFLAGARSPAGL